MPLGPGAFGEATLRPEQGPNLLLVHPTSVFYHYTPF